MRGEFSPFSIRIVVSFGLQIHQSKGRNGCTAFGFRNENDRRLKISFIKTSHNTFLPGMRVGRIASGLDAMFNGGQYIIAVKRLSKESRQGLDEFMNASKMHCEASTSKPHKASGILQRARREDFDL
uniref:Uncharacterized protein n=1 Tax=Salix viminalis TaxID=40686 RepID=A0A6N2MFS0_SALVM